MTEATMTIHQALAENKMLGSRIEKKMSEVKLVTANRHIDKKVNGVSLAEYNNRVTEDYQSINDLMQRRIALKRAIATSNANTIVSIGGKEYTVVDAIEMKNHGIPLQQKLLFKMKDEYEAATSVLNYRNGDLLDDKVQSYLTASLGGTADKGKGISEDVQKQVDAFRLNHTYELINPLDILQKISDLSDEIDDFLVNVDSSLSVSNATTNITFSY